jgi:alkanesulfonate monooxygenase SsuD/methylene tetrahydromethanopterin reductase-like flavin-dependent oxidoreductase (luciferase family)
VKVALMLPTFTVDAAMPIRAAALAEANGLDGAFAFDHLWPMGNPTRPALWSFGVLGAVAAVTTRLSLGPLVARIDLLPEEKLVDAFATLAAIAGDGRVIAALGAGDHLSAAENEAYGIGQGPAADRLDAVARTADRLRARGLATWIGGTSVAASRVAREHADAHNLWSVTAEDVHRRVERDGDIPPKTWGGQVLIGEDASELADLRATYGERDGLVSGTVAQVAAALRAYEEVGVTWCVCAPLDYLRRPRRAVETLCLVAEAVK